MNAKSHGIILFSLLFPFFTIGQTIYAGGGFGNGFNKKKFTDLRGDDFQIKESQLAWKVFATAELNFLGAEGGFRTFNTVETTSDLGRGTSQTRGGDIMARGTFRILIFNVFGKFGGFFARTRNRVIDAQGNTLIDEIVRQPALLWGFGGGVQLGILQVRLEYENIELNPSNLGMLSVNALIRIRRLESNR